MQNAMARPSSPRQASMAAHARHMAHIQTMADRTGDMTSERAFFKAWRTTNRSVYLSILHKSKGQAQG